MEVVFVAWFSYLCVTAAISWINMTTGYRKRDYSVIEEDIKQENGEEEEEADSQPAPPHTKVKRKKVGNEPTTSSTENKDFIFRRSILSEYERKRQENVRDNARFMASIGIFKAKDMFDASIPAKQKISSKPKPKSSPRPKRVYAPTRRSARIQRIDPSGLPLPPLPEVVEEKDERKPLGPLKMTEFLSEGNKEADSKTFSVKLKNLSNTVDTSRVKEPTSKSLKSFLSGFSKVEVTESRVRKVVESRIFSLAMHPSQEKVLVGAGGKWGSIGLWDVKQGLTEGGAVCYNPHTKPVNGLSFNPHNLDQLYSCSYDGTLRCGYFEKNIFQAVYYTPEEDDISLRGFSFYDANTVFVAQSDGDVAIVDTRVKSGQPEKLWTASLKGLRSVDVHPVKRQYFVTAGIDCNVCVWDVRSLQSQPTKLCSMPAARMVDSAYFSPITGHYILATAQDDRIRLYDSSKISSNIPCVHTISHNNQTGRWLTKFRASWHPSREDLFVCGSMNRPRQIELYSDNASCIMVLHHPDLINSVQSLNLFHPTINALVGANASGKLHVFL
ncbi:WD repeat-containing protein 76-like [Argonauta hians]